MILDLLFHTPFYVYPLLAYLLFAGWRASKVRVVSYYKVLILSGVLLAFSIRNILKLDLNLDLCALFFLSTIASIFIGLQVTGRQRVEVDKTTRSLTLPGSWMTLVLVLFLFSTKYYLGYRTAQHLLSLRDMQLTIFTSAFSCGWVLGKLIHYARSYASQVQSRDA